MARSGSNHPTELELEILKVLWDTSPLPVREVRARLEEQADGCIAKAVDYCTTNRDSLWPDTSGSLSLVPVVRSRPSTTAPAVIDVMAEPFQPSALLAVV